MSSRRGSKSGTIWTSEASVDYNIKKSADNFGSHINVSNTLLSIFVSLLYSLCVCCEADVVTFCALWLVETCIIIINFLVYFWRRTNKLSPAGKLEMCKYLAKMPISDNFFLSVTTKKWQVITLLMLVVVFTCKGQFESQKCDF